MRIAFDARYVNDRYDGVGRHAFGLLEALTRRDRSNQYAVFFHPGYANSRFDLRALAERPNVQLHPLRLPLLTPLEQVVWPRVLHASGVDLFHSPYVFVPLTAARRALVMTMHDLIFERFPTYMPWRWLRPYYALMSQLAVRAATLLLTVSRSTQRDIQAYYPRSAGKVRVTGNAVDPSFREVRDPTRLEAVRRRYGLPPRFVLALGAGRPHKNLGMLVDAFAQVKSTSPVALVVAGAQDARFDDEVSMHARQHELGTRVLRPGRIREQDLAAVYSLADLYAMPSIVEGFGMPVLEAMACGTPVVASNTPSVAEVAGDAALSFDPTDRDQLASSIEAGLENAALRSRLTAAGRARAAMFTWDRVAESTLDAYAQACDSDL